jgi:hypothetical protein
MQCHASVLPDHGLSPSGGHVRAWPDAWR